ncbi:MAG: redoxin domain-containing protein [Phycisphaerales bacterium]|nr:MAG: redoxin domain-containing protein [Phycisphaerales bacterium]
MRSLCRKRVCGVSAILAVCALGASLPAWAVQQAGTSNTAGAAVAQRPEERALLQRIAELGRDPQRGLWMSSGAYRELILSRRQEQIAKIHELLERFPDSPAQEDVLEYKLESLFAIANLMKQPPTELKEAVRQVLAGSPGKSLEGTASFWRIQVDLYEKVMAGADGQELAKYQIEQFAQLAEKYPDNRHFGDAILGNMVQVRLMEGKIEEARSYYQKLQKYHPDSELIEPLAGELRRRDALLKPFTFAFTDIRGQEVDTTKMKGKVILVDFWASWCGGCVMSVPELKRLYDKHHDDGLEIIGVNLDTDRRQLDGFLNAHKIPWPQYFDGKAWNTPLARKYGITGIPALFLVDKKGILRSIDAHGQLQSEIVKLLAE